MRFWVQNPDTKPCCQRLKWLFSLGCWLLFGFVYWFMLNRKGCLWSSLVTFYPLYACSLDLPTLKNICFQIKWVTDSFFSFSNLLFWSLFHSYLFYEISRKKLRGRDWFEIISNWNRTHVTNLLSKINCSWDIQKQHPWHFYTSTGSISYQYFFYEEWLA